jgi:hypothetical protein
MMRPTENGGKRFSARLSESLNQRLNGYALAAGAAGVALMACSVPSEAAPVCKNISFMFSGTNTYALNPVHQRVAPFNIVQTYAEVSSLTSTRFNRGFFTPNFPGADVMLAANGLPADLASGANIGPGGRFGEGQSYGLLFTYGPRAGTQYNHLGNLKFGKTNYFGYKFLISGKTHYGWVRITAQTVYYGYVESEIISSGYESAPDTAIAAGSCASVSPSTGAVPVPQNGTGSRSNADVSASAATPKAGTPRPTSLGMLALGAQGIPLWRWK